MAFITPTIQETPWRSDHCHIVYWGNMANGDIGSEIEMPGSGDRTIQMTGVFGSGGSIVLEGSNDNLTYFVLTDPNGDVLSFSSNGLKAVTEVTRFIRPRVVSGDVTTLLSANLLLRRAVR